MISYTNQYGVSNFLLNFSKKSSAPSSFVANFRIWCRRSPPSTNALTMPGGSLSAAGPVAALGADPDLCYGDS